MAAATGCTRSGYGLHPFCMGAGRHAPMTIRLPYAAAAIALFAIEVLIALFVDDAVVRPLSATAWR